MIVLSSWSSFFSSSLDCGRGSLETLEFELSCGIIELNLSNGMIASGPASPIIARVGEVVIPPFANAGIVGMDDSNIKLSPNGLYNSNVKALFTFFIRLLIISIMALIGVLNTPLIADPTVEKIDIILFFAFLNTPIRESAIPEKLKKLDTPENTFFTLVLTTSNAPVNFSTILSLFYIFI